MSLNDHISCVVTAHFEDQVYQYRKYPRKTVLLKNESGETITEVTASITSDNFVIWQPGSVSSATIPADEYFHVMVDFQPQSIGNITEGLKFNYKKSGVDYIQYLDNCMSGEGIAIPAADYYVATTGDDDSGNGSIANPFATIKKAFGLCSSGELIYLRQGDYDEHIGEYSGGASAHADHNDASGWDWNITIASYPGETATIKRVGTQDTELDYRFEYLSFLFGLTGEKYFTFEDIVFDGISTTGTAGGTTYLGSCTYHSSYIKFWNCEFKNRHDWSYPILNGTPRSFNSLLGISTTGIELWYCQFHNCDEHAIYVGSSSGGPSPSSPDWGERAATDCKIMYCEIYDTGMNATGEADYYQGYGIHCNNNNTVSTQGSWYRPYMTRNLFEGNYVHSCNGGGILLGGNLGSTAQNNIVRDCIRGIADYYSGCSGNLFINNTIFDCTYGTEFSQSSSSVSAYNNIFYNNTADFATIAATNPTIQKNIISDNTLENQGSISSGNFNNVDPLLIDYSNNVYSLSSNSSAIIAGKVIDSLTLDYYGLPRTSTTPDIGAVDYFTSDISVDPTNFTFIHYYGTTYWNYSSSITISNNGTRTFSYTADVVNNTFYNTTYNVDVSEWIYTNSIFFNNSATAGTLIAGSSSSFSFWGNLGYSLIIFPSSLTGELTVSTDDGVVEYITYDAEISSAGTLSANPTTGFNFNQGDTLTGTLEIYNTNDSESMLYTIITEDTPDNYLMGINFDKTSDWIEINDSITSTHQIIVDNSSSSYDFSINTSSLNMLVTNTGYISILTSDGPLTIPVTINPPITETDQERNSSGGKAVYPRVSGQPVVGDIDELEGLVSKTLIRDKNVKQFDKDIKTWLKAYTGAEKETKVSAFALLNLAKLAKLSNQTGSMVFINRGLETYLNNLVNGELDQSFNFKNKVDIPNYIKLTFEAGKNKNNKL